VEIRWRFNAGSRTRVETEINPAIRDIASRRGLILADNHALFAGRPDLLLEIHPSEEGYKLLAGAWHRILAPLLSSAAARKTGVQ
jgi:lysophospholipase L1-like esterase